MTRKSGFSHKLYTPFLLPKTGFTAPGYDVDSHYCWYKKSVLVNVWMPIRRDAMSLSATITPMTLESTSLPRFCDVRVVDIRNSSIRAKPANQRRLERGEIKDATIRRLLRMKISWASTVVVLIGNKTHERPWVNWEIEQATKQGKRIVGVYVHGSSDADKPEALEQYASAIVGWDSKRIIAAIDGTDNPFELPDGSPRPPVHPATSVKC